MICALHLRTNQWKKVDLLVLFRTMETSQLDVANYGPTKGNAGIGCLDVFWFYCMQCSS